MGCQWALGFDKATAPRAARLARGAFLCGAGWQGGAGFCLRPQNFIAPKFADVENCFTFAPHFPHRDAQMAESVDALVSNTSGATHPGSTPGLGTRKSAK